MADIPATVVDKAASEVLSHDSSFCVTVDLIGVACVDVKESQP